MNTWILEPRDTIVVRDGRPLADGASEMRSLDFPWPSTVAGLVRTRIGLSENGKFEMTPDEARQVEIRGPLLARVAPGPGELLVPAARDNVVYPHESGLRRYRLGPRPLPDGIATDLQGLQVVSFLAEPPEGKPEPRPAAFWTWPEMERWLTRPTDVLDLAPGAGHRSLVHETRVHVAIDPGTGTAMDGALFSTDGLRFAGRKAGGSSERLALAFSCHDTRLEGKAGVVVAGGERRPAFLRPSPVPFPASPEALVSSARNRYRLVLLTPGLFAAGHRPAALPGARIVAAVVPRPQVISGWDMERQESGKNKGKPKGPKPTRRAVPAGSVFWVELNEGVDPARWVRERWLSSLCDDEQDARDGFGLVVVGVA